jgi:hypothetical protein
MTLHVFELDDTDWVVATDAEDAWAIWEETTREKREQHGGWPDVAWVPLPDDKALTIHYPDVRESHTETCGEWVRSNGRGWLCSSEY